MDNYFTSFRLLTHLGVYPSVFNPGNNIRVTGGLNKNMLRKCTIIGGKQLQKKKKKRYQFEQRTSSKKGSATSTVVGWNNDREVYIVSPKSSEPKRFVRSWSKVGTKYIQEKQPN